MVSEHDPLTVKEIKYSTYSRYYAKLFVIVKLSILNLKKKKLCDLWKWNDTCGSGFRSSDSLSRIACDEIGWMINQFWVIFYENKRKKKWNLWDLLLCNILHDFNPRNNKSCFSFVIFEISLSIYTCCGI